MDIQTTDPSFATQPGSLNKNMTSLMRRISDPFVRSEQTVQAALATLRLCEENFTFLLTFVTAQLNPFRLTSAEQKMLVV